VVATNSGGTREIFPDEVAGAVLVPVDDPSAMASAVNELVRDSLRRQALGAAARARAEAAFDVQRAAKELIDLYRGVLKL
jgi:starch synthase